MNLAPQSIQLLREIINEKSQYRSGPQLVDFFNQLGFSDVYSWGGGFPSRKDYTYDRLSKINGTAAMDKCLRLVFEPRNYVGRYQDLENLIKEFNAQLCYDGWLVVRKDAEISFRKATNPNIDAEIEKERNETCKRELTEQEFFIIGKTKSTGWKNEKYIFFALCGERSMAASNKPGRQALCLLSRLIFRSLPDANVAPGYFFVGQTVAVECRCG